MRERDRGAISCGDDPMEMQREGCWVHVSLFAKGEVQEGAALERLLGAFVFCICNG